MPQVAIQSVCLVNVAPPSLLKTSFKSKPRELGKSKLEQIRSISIQAQHTSCLTVTTFCVCVCCVAKEAACTRAEMCGAKVLLQCEALRVTVTRVGVQYRALSIWLLQILQRMEVESGNSREGEGPAAAGLSAGAQVLA